jgi:ribosomal protein S18 acetylase RimI-like enzyme
LVLVRQGLFESGELRFAQDTSTSDDVLNHLACVDDLLSPKISDRIDLGTYAQKIVLRATRFEAWEQDTLVGLVAAYVDLDDQRASVTHLAVMERCQHRRVGHRLMSSLLQALSEGGITWVDLEVAENNIQAQNFYRHMDFVVVGIRQGFSQLRRNLT